MYFKIIRNELKTSKLINIIMILFIVVAAMLAALAAVLTVNLLGSIDTLMANAKTPHFMQMHSGKVDSSRLALFKEQNKNVEDFQIIDFLNIDGAEIIIGDKSLSGSVQDNGFSTQSPGFDYLFDLNGQKINCSDGELYVPICYLKDGTAKQGDQARINGRVFTVAGFVRDSMMMSTLSSSKRFLVSENDFKALRDIGKTESLIEFRLKDPSGLSAFETAYTLADLETNGPAITYPLIRTLNAISDGMMIGVILFVSILIVVVAFLCIRFTLLAKIEEDILEIGVMKAIGLRNLDIKRMYLAQYAVLALTGSILGYGLSFVFKGFLLKNIRLYLGAGDKTGFDSLLGGAGTILIFLAVLAFVNGVLKRLKKLSPAEAVRFGKTQDNVRENKGPGLSKNRIINTNILLGIIDVFSRKRLYTAVLDVLSITIFIIIVPQNLYNTLSSKSFTQYMGVGDCDIRFDLQQTSNISGKAAKIAKSLEEDPSIIKYAVLTTKSFKAVTEAGTEEIIKVELGDHSVFPLKYADGKAPSAENEIALSAINAKELGKKVGDTIRLIIGERERNLTVCGIYSDITNGGKTAKAVFTDETAPTMWCVIGAKLVYNTPVDEKIKEYAGSFGHAKISDVYEYIYQTFGPTINSIKNAAAIVAAAALAVSALITVLFMKMLIARDGYDIAAMKALGFRNSEIALQYISRMVFVLIISMITGTILANTLGEFLAGAVISSFGASSFKFVINPISAYLISPVMFTCTILVTAFAGTQGAGEIDIPQYVKE
jgi:putative ABC transport system permease protein